MAKSSMIGKIETVFNTGVCNQWTGELDWSTDRLEYWSVHY